MAAAEGEPREDERLRLLIRRIRAGLALVVVSVTSFSAADLATGRGGDLFLLLVQGSQLAVVALVYVVCRRPWFVRRAEPMALSVVSYLYLSTTTASILTGDTLTLQILFIVISMGTGALLPWGVPAQIASVAVGTLSTFLSLHVVHDGLVNGFGYPTVAMLVAFVGSIIVTRELDRYRGTLLRQAAALAQAQELAGVGSWEWWIVDNRVVWSDQLYRIYGLSPGEFEATYAAYLERLHPEDRDLARRVVAQALEDHQPFAFDHRIVRPDGSVRHLHGRGEVVLDGEGRPSRMVGTAQDVTDRKRFEDELAKARDAALEASAVKSAFLANVSHEIRTPLNIILGYSEFIGEHLRGAGDPTLLSFQDGITRACQRLLDTIQTILDFSRMEAGAFEVRPTRIRINQCLARHVQDFQPLAAAKGLSLSFDDAEPGVEIRFDEYCLSSAVLNLLQNALKFTDRGTIEVRLFRDATGSICLLVRDTGIGMDASFLARLFEPFSQEDSGYTRRFEGAGLGLAVTRRYLEMNGASISVESQKGRGTSFLVRFPRECEVDRAERATALAS